MSIIIPSCDDDSEPPDERPNCCLVSPEEGGKNVFSLYPRPILTLVHKVRVQPPLKSKARPNRGSLRSLISVHVVRDDRYLRRRLAILWRNTVYSLEYSPLIKELSNDEAIDTAHTRSQIQSSPACRLISPSDPEIGIDEEKLQHSPCNNTVEESALEKTLSLPTIIITPPSTSDDAGVYNVVPTPQDSASGVYLTVPDFDFQFTKRQRGNGASCRWNGAFERRFHTVTIPSSGSHLNQPKLHITTTIPGDLEEKDQVIDLGPTWSG